MTIIGGGIAGLAAAWRLRRAGFEDYTLLEMEDVLGGTSCSETAGGFSYPWGAHYLTTPMHGNRSLIRLLAEMNVIVGTQEDGEPRVDEPYLCREPEERIFADGQWVGGAFPYHLATAADQDQLAVFRAEMQRWAERRDERGRRMFAIPMAAGSDVADVRALDRISMADWMDERGFTSRPLRWQVNHACRDDYGLTAENTSAWAGIFYYASRLRGATEGAQEVITWPEGNGRIVNYLAAVSQSVIRPSHAVTRVTPRIGSDVVKVLVWNTHSQTAIEVVSDQVIFAAPQFLAPHLIDHYAEQRGGSSKAFRYGSWLVANVHLEQRPREQHFPMCWDNVNYHSESLGYVTSTHQTGADYGPTVLTWYHPLADLEPALARKQLLALGWEDWAQVVLADLEKVHPGISTSVRRLDVMRWGHAMIQPRPGFIWSDERRTAAEPFGGVHFANTDLSGVALLEEAFYHGIRAAEEVLSARQYPFEPMES